MWWAVSSARQLGHRVASVASDQGQKSYQNSRKLCPFDFRLSSDKVFSQGEPPQLLWNSEKPIWYLGHPSVGRGTSCLLKFRGNLSPSVDLVTLRIGGGRTSLLKSA